MGRRRGRMIRKSEDLPGWWYHIFVDGSYDTDFRIAREIPDRCSYWSGFFSGPDQGICAMHSVTRLILLSMFSLLLALSPLLVQEALERGRS